jgi:predicted  nucleic acid-binding Zn-ribbon protein
VIAHFESEISLREQRIDALEKYLSDTKETLDRQQSTHASQIEVLQGKLNSERRELTDKVDALTQEITRKERTCTTLENQKEALVMQIAQRDK